MNCNQIDRLMDDYVDGLLDDTSANAVRQHTAGCASCRALEEDLRLIVGRAPELAGPVDPSMDLWQRIGPALEPRGESEETMGHTDHRPFVSWMPVLMAAAIVLAAGVTVVLIGSGSRIGENEVAGTTPSSAIPSIEPGPEATRPAARVGAGSVAFYEARQELLAAVQQQGNRLSPKTIESVKSNLKIIDDAIREIQTALDRDPGNRELEKMLIAQQQREVAMLRRVAGTATLR